jgi:proteasome lid subunit RPN8/RPN11
MANQVADLAPEESCGVLAGHGNVVEVCYPIQNILHSPFRFKMDPQAQVDAFMDIERRDLQLVCIYHSHPTGPRGPSETDIQEFAYPGVIYLIWAPSDAGTTVWDARGFQLKDGTALQVPVIIQ